MEVGVLGGSVALTSRPQPQDAWHIEQSREPLALTPPFLHRPAGPRTALHRCAPRPVRTAHSQPRVAPGGDGDYVQLPSHIFDDFEAATVEAWVKWEDFAYFTQWFGFGSGSQFQAMGLNHRLGPRHRSSSSTTAIGSCMWRGWRPTCQKVAGSIWRPYRGRACASI